MASWALGPRCNAMGNEIERRIRELKDLTVGQLRARYEALTGEGSRSSNRRYLIRRIAWRIQAEQEGGLSERALRRAEELADVEGLRLSAPRTRGAAGNVGSKTHATRRRGTFAAGTVFVRRYKDRVIEVTVAEDGFRCNGDVYTSLSAVARAVTGSRWSGRVFFGLTPRRRKR